jgi:hypothetical protein
MNEAHDAIGKRTAAMSRVDSIFHTASIALGKIFHACWITASRIH